MTRGSGEGNISFISGINSAGPLLGALDPDSVIEMDPQSVQQDPQSVTAPRPALTHFIKVRFAGERRFSFLTREGTTRLRVHASQFTHENAQKALEVLRADNPEHEFKIVPIYPRAAHA